MTVRLVIKWKPQAPSTIGALALNSVSEPAVIAPPVCVVSDRADHRSQKRQPVKYRFSVYSEREQSGHRSFLARGINMSRAGVLIETDEPLPVGSTVYIKVKELGLMGTATVRHCTAKGVKFRVGLYFANPLTRVV